MKFYKNDKLYLHGSVFIAVRQMGGGVTIKIFISQTLKMCQMRGGLI